MKKRVATRTTRKPPATQLVLNQTQVGLALGFVAIGVLMAFGVGFVVGMWYQATERVTPYEAEFVPSTKQEAQARPPGVDSPLDQPLEGQKAPASPVSTPVVTEGAVPSAGPGYSVQVGSFRTREQAEQLHGRLMQKGYPARIEVSQVTDRGMWYRVRVGHFADRADADRAAQRLVSQEQLSVMVTDAVR